MRRAGAMALLFLVGWTGTAAAAAAAPSATTNAAAFDSVALAVASELVPPGSVPAGKSLELASPLQGDTLAIVEQRVLQRLKTDGVSVRVKVPETASIDPVTGQPRPAEPPADPADLRLEVLVAAKSVAYLKRIGSFPFGTKGYERQVAVQAQSRLLDGRSGEVLWTHAGERRLTDTVRAGDVEAVAASGAGLFRPAIPPGRGLRFLEPVIVGGIVASLVILFYSNRT